MTFFPSYPKCQLSWEKSEKAIASTITSVCLSCGTNWTKNASRTGYSRETEREILTSRCRSADALARLPPDKVRHFPGSVLFLLALPPVGSYLAWTWNNWDCSSGPSLIADYSGTPTGFGIGYQAHLKNLPDHYTP